MVSASRLDVDQLIACSSDLIDILNEKKDITTLKNQLDQFLTLKSQCDSDFEHAKFAIEDYQKKIDMCKQKIAEAKSEEASDAELDFLQKELSDELKRECSLREELRATANDIHNIESQMVSIEDRRLTLKKLEQADKRADLQEPTLTVLTFVRVSIEADDTWIFENGRWT